MNSFENKFLLKLVDMVNNQGEDDVNSLLMLISFRCQNMVWRSDIWSCVWNQKYINIGLQKLTIPFLHFNTNQLKYTDLSWRPEQKVESGIWLEVNDWIWFCCTANDKNQCTRPAIFSSEQFTKPIRVSALWAREYIEVKDIASWDK